MEKTKRRSNVYLESNEKMMPMSSMALKKHVMKAVSVHVIADRCPVTYAENGRGLSLTFRLALATQVFRLHVFGWKDCRRLYCAH